MTYGVTALSKILFIRETTAGTLPLTGSTATYWRGTGFPKDDRVVTKVDEQVGILGGTTRQYVGRLGASFALAATPATFEQVNHVLEMGLETDAPAADGSGSGKIYEYDFPTTAQLTNKTYTVQGGDNNQAEGMSYCFVNDFTLEGEQGGAWNVSANLMGRTLAPVTYYSTASIPAVEEILFSKTKLYIDAAGGTMGTTLKSATLMKASLKVTTGWIPITPGGDGELYFPAIKNVGDVSELQITFEHEGTAVAEKAAWRAETGRLIRLKAEGSAFTTAGTTYTYKTMLIDLAGTWRTFDAITGQNGNDICVGTFDVDYSETDAFKGKITVVNALASVPG